MKSVKKFVYDVGWVLVSSVVVLLLHFLQKPLMARYLGPDGLGIFTMVTTIAGITALITGLGINGAIVKYVAEYKDDKDRLHAVFSSALAAMAIIGVATVIFLFTLSYKFSSIFNMPSLTFLLKIYAFVFPFLLMYGIIMGLFNGLREMKYYSFINILNSILIFILTITFLFNGFGIKGAVVADMLATIMVTVVAAVIMKKFIKFSISNYRENIKKLTSFGSKLMLGNVINNVNYQADTLLIAYYLTAGDLGYYSAAVSLSRFFWRIPQSIQMISYPATSEYWAKGELKSLNKMINKSMKYSACLLLPVGFGVWIFAKEIIVFLFGESFIFSVFPFQILVIGTVIYAIGIPVGGTLVGIGRPDLSLKINTVGAIMNIILNITLIPNFGVAGAAVATISSLILITTLSIYFIIKLTNVDIDIKWYISAFITTLLSAAAFLACSGWINIYLLGSLIVIIYMVIFFAFFLTKEDKKMFTELISSNILKR